MRNASVVTHEANRLRQQLGRVLIVIDDEHAQSPTAGAGRVALRSVVSCLVDTRAIASGEREPDLKFATAPLPFAPSNDVAAMHRHQALHDREPEARARLAVLAAKYGRRIEGFDDGALQILRTYTWPGNVRELGNVIERAVLMARGASITAANASGVSIAFTGLPAAGEVWTLTLDGTPHPYTVQPGDSLASVIAQLRARVPAGYTTTVTANILTIQKLGSNTTASVTVSQPTAGSIRFEGVDISALRGAELMHYRRAVQVVFQDPYSSLSPRMRVGDIIAAVRTLPMMSPQRVVVVTHADVLLVPKRDSEAATRALEELERVLTNDPGMGVIRHVDAGYAHAAEIAAERGVRIPMRDSR